MIQITNKNLLANYAFKVMDKGTLAAQLVKCLTLDFGSGHDLRVLGLSPVLGSALSGDSARDSLPLPLPLPLFMLSLK